MALTAPSHLFLEEVDIQNWAQDTECKSHNHFWQRSYRVLEMPPLQQVPMMQRMLKEQEEAFWCRLDMVTGEELEMGPPPPTIQL